jgi:hypothetical protein
LKKCTLFFNKFGTNTKSALQNTHGWWVEEMIRANLFLNWLREHWIHKIQKYLVSTREAPTHFTLTYLMFVITLTIYFIHASWIGRRGTEWPAYSPDLSRLDFFLWGHLKCRVYKNRPHNLQDKIQLLKKSIVLRHKWFRIYSNTFN